MKPFDLLAFGFLTVAILNLFLVPKRGWRAIGLAVASILCAAATYLWERGTDDLSKWVLAAAAGVFLATVFYEAGRRKTDQK